MSNILQNCSRGFPSQFRRTSDLTTCHSYILFSRGCLIEVISKSIRQNDLWDILIINTFTVLLLDAYEFPTRSMKFYTFEIYYLPISFMILLLKLLSQLHLTCKISKKGIFLSKSQKNFFCFSWGMKALMPTSQNP